MLPQLTCSPRRCAGSHLAVWLLLLPLAAAAGPAATKKETDLLAYDGRYHSVSTQFYSLYARSRNQPKAESMNALVEEVAEYRRQGKLVEAVATVLANLPLVEKNVDTNAIIGIVDLLLEANEWDTASALHKKVGKHGNRSLVAGISFSMAKYHFSRNRWRETIALVENLRGDLPAEDFNHAQLLHGISLQQLQKHRPSLAVYARIPRTSNYYVAARLNMAIANIRQDWWTDAHILINDLLSDKNRQHDTGLTDRLYTVLGYSQLKQQYYRHSRDSFRHVGLDGKYSNRALLGMALTAAYQEDFLGALNAAQILKARPPRDLPVDEAHLLIPHFHEKLRQFDTASTGYSEAILHLESRILGIRATLSPEPRGLFEQIATSESSVVALGSETVDLGDTLPRYLFGNIRLLGRFRQQARSFNDAGLNRQMDAIENDYGKLLQQTVTRLQEEKITHLTHYMNQSRYGLARMQDQDATAKK